MFGFKTSEGIIFVPGFRCFCGSITGLTNWNGVQVMGSVLWLRLKKEGEAMEGKSKYRRASEYE